jgi:two-component system LytT family response regulator
MYKAIIIDDESKPRELLKIKIEDLMPALKVVATASSALEGFQLCNEYHPDLVFLDVQMPEYSGFDFVKMFENVNFEIIFVTAYTEFLLDAFKISAVGYVLKPVNNDELVQAIDHAIQKIKLKQNAERYKSLLFNLQPNNTLKRFVIPCHDRYEFIIKDDIVFCQGDEKYTQIITKDGAKFLCTYNIGKVKMILNDDSFFLCHKSFLINVHFVKSLTSEDEILMAHNATRIPLARRRKIDFLSYMRL